MSNHHPHLAAAVRDGVARGVAAVGLAGVALIHLLDAPGKFAETPYLAWMYIGLIVSCLGIAYALVRTSSPRAWAAAIVVPAAAIVGFTLTRTVGLPQAHGDIGNWSEPLGMASLFVEGSLIALGVTSLLERRRQPAVEQVPARSEQRSTVGIAA